MLSLRQNLMQEAQRDGDGPQPHASLPGSEHWLLDVQTLSLGLSLTMLRCFRATVAYRVRTGVPEDVHWPKQKPVFETEHSLHSDAGDGDELLKAFLHLTEHYLCCLFQTLPDLLLQLWVLPGTIRTRSIGLNIQLPIGIKCTDFSSVPDAGFGEWSRLRTLDPGLRPDSGTSCYCIAYDALIPTSQH